MTTFDKREEAFENRFAHDEELLFRAKARRTSKVARWAAALMGRADAETYAGDLVALEVSAGHAAVVSRIKADLTEAGHTLSDHQIAREMDDALLAAEREIREG